jgi:hypothetical protein
MILLKITEEEKPILLEALHFFGSELDARVKGAFHPDEEKESLSKMIVLDQIIDVLKLTERFKVC